MPDVSRATGEAAVEPDLRAAPRSDQFSSLLYTLACLGTCLVLVAPRAHVPLSVSGEGEFLLGGGTVGFQVARLMRALIETK
jgi:hypothetical protein